MQKTTQVASKIFFILLLISPAIIIQIAAQSPAVLDLIILVQAYLPVYLVALLVLKALSIIYPPLPGVAFTIASIPLVGWQLAYFIDISGSLLGASVSFFLGRKYGYTILQRVIGKIMADKIIDIKLKQRNQIEAAIFLRIATGGMLSDGLAWGASLIGFTYASFIIGYGISHILTTLPIFYFLAASISFNSWIVVAVAAIVAWIVIYKCKGRYFE